MKNLLLSRDLRPGDILRRSVRGIYFLDHYGVVYGYRNGKLFVFENSKGGSPTLVPYEEFAGRGVVHYQRISEGDRSAAISRIDWMLGNPRAWNATEFNCEHAARFAAEGRVYSSQVRDVVLLGLIGGLLALIARE